MAPSHSPFLSNMFRKESYADVAIVIHGEELPAHRLVICSQSGYFEKAFQDAFIEGQRGRIEFNDGSAAAHWRVMEYLYTGDYGDEWQSNHYEDDPAMLRDARVYGLAEMFFIEGLKKLSIEKLNTKLNLPCPNQTFIDCIQEVYAVTGGSNRMRDMVARKAARRRSDLYKEQVFKDLLHKGGDFVVDVFGSL